MHFFVPGKPEAQGSMRAFVRGGRAVLTSNNARLKPWRATVADVATSHGWDGKLLLDGAVWVDMIFCVLRPQSHYGTKGLKESAPKFPITTGGDLDKLIRGVGDALTGVVWRDDRRIIGINARRVFDPREGVSLRIERLTSQVYDVEQEQSYELYEGKSA
jgi:crossover junction endodeoxyribonuclease RusA